MEEQLPGQGEHSTTPSETNDRGLTDFLGKKDNKSSQQDVAMIDLEGQDTELNEKRTHTLLEELQRTHTNSSSSSDEEVEDGREGRKRKKKGLMKDMIVKEKISREEQLGELDNGNGKLENQEATSTEEKKGFLEKIIDKLPGHGHHNKTEEGTPTTIPANQEDSSGGETKEKKGIFDKIKEKLPGHHKNEDEPKLKEN